MNEQTAIELLKITSELAAAAIAKCPNVVAPGQKAGAAITFTEIYSDCAKVVHDQYQQLTKGTIDTGQ